MNQAARVYANRLVPLSPAYDVTYAYNPAGDWTSSHQMLVNGKARGISDADMIECAKEANLSEAKARSIVNEVRGAVRDWPLFAAEAEVKGGFVEKIAFMLKN